MKILHSLLTGQGGGLKVSKTEFYKVSVGLKAAYPRFTFLSTDEEMEFWYQMLKDFEYVVAYNAAMEYISTNTFPPSIADIRALCVERCKKSVLNFDEAWGMVQKAISRFGNDRPQEAFATMDELTISVVKNLGWSRLCHSDNQAADRANFREAYEAKANKLRNDMQIPEFVAKSKQQIQKRYIPSVEEKEMFRIEDTQMMVIREDPTEEQVTYHSQLIEETRRQLLGG